VDDKAKYAAKLAQYGFDCTHIQERITDRAR